MREADCLKADVSIKTHHISELEETLKQTRSRLCSKEDTGQTGNGSAVPQTRPSSKLCSVFMFSLSCSVQGLEEKLSRSETDRLNCSQQLQTLELRLQSVQAELAEKVQQLQELQRALCKAQSMSQEQQALVDTLRFQLR